MADPPGSGPPCADTGSGALPSPHPFPPPSNSHALAAPSPVSSPLLPPAAASTRPPPDWWRDQWREDDAAAAASTSSAAPVPRFLPPRSAQLDAMRLDAELASLLGEQVARILAPWDDGGLLPGAAPALPGRALLAAARPELAAALDALAFAATVGRGRPTPGMRMLNLRFADVRGGRSAASPDLPGLSASQRAAFFLLSVGGRYAAARLGRAAAARRWAAAAAAGGGTAGAGNAASSLANTLAAVDTALAVGGLLNLVAFLSGAGAHRSLVERAVGAAAVPADPAAPRSLSFDYLNRQLVWHGLAEFMLFLLPLVEPARIGRAVSGWLPRVGSLAVGEGGGAAPGSSPPSSAASDPRLTAPPRPGCGWCGRADPPSPFAALPCTHVHCYWCLASAAGVGGGEGGGEGGGGGGGADGGAGGGVHCPTCGERVVAMVRAARRRRGGGGGGAVEQ